MDPVQTREAPRRDAPPGEAREEVESVVIRFAGDSGDGMQLTGSQFTQATALKGNDLATFPDYPAEIRAPAGTMFGVSAFQIQFAAFDVLTPGDAPDVLVAMNPAALRAHLGDLRTGGLLVVNTGAFTPQNLKKAGYEQSPLEDETLRGHKVVDVDITKLTLLATQPFQLSQKEALRCKNMWTLGLVYWLFDRDRHDTLEFLRRQFEKRPELAQANIAALNAGHAYGETIELPAGLTRVQVPKAPSEPGLYRNVTGNEATAWGLIAGCRSAGLTMMLGSYPITPASDVLHYLSGLKHFDVVTFQAEDEIAAICSAIGASFAGSLGVTTTSGPGMALKTEAIGLAVATELPLVIVDVQRGGPSTGLPTKTEQSDLFQAVLGRNGDTPLVVLAAATPGDCFAMAIEAVRLSTRYMTPVILLTDGYLANGAEPWRVPELDELPRFPVQFRRDPEGFHPFARDPETLARPWAIPGTPALLHRIGGLERDQASGNISYDPANHHRMTKLRAAKIARVALDIPLQTLVEGEESGELLVVSWGSTYGAVREGVRRARRRGLPVAHTHLRYMWPFPRNLGEMLARYQRVLVPEMNNGQLVKLLRAEFLAPAVGFDKIHGQPFKVSEIEDEIREALEA